MNLQTLFYFMLLLALISSVLNIIFYTIGYSRVRKSKVDGSLARVKKVIIEDLVTSLFLAVCLTIVFGVVIFLPQYTTPVLYFLGVVLFVLSISYNRKAISLASIVEDF